MDDTPTLKLARYLEAEAEPRRRDHFKDLFSQAAKHLREQANSIDTLTAENEALKADLQFMAENRDKWQDATTVARRKIAELEAALKPFADIGIGSDPDYQPMIRMDRDAIVAARSAIAAKPA